MRNDTDFDPRKHTFSHCWPRRCPSSKLVPEKRASISSHTSRSTMVSPEIRISIRGVTDRVGLDKYDTFLREVQEEPSTYNPDKLRSILDSFRDVLFR